MFTALLAVAPVFAARPVLALAALAACAFLRCTWLDGQCAGDPITAALLFLPVLVLEEFLRHGLNRALVYASEKGTTILRWLHVTVSVVMMAAFALGWLHERTGLSVEVIAAVAVACAATGFLAWGHVKLQHVVGAWIDTGMIGGIAQRVATIAAAALVTFFPVVGLVVAVGLLVVVVALLLVVRSLARHIGTGPRPQSARARAATTFASRLLPIPFVGPLLRRLLDRIVIAVEQRQQAKPIIIDDPTRPA